MRLALFLAVLAGAAALAACGGHRHANLGPPPEYEVPDVGTAGSGPSDAGAKSDAR